MNANSMLKLSCRSICHETFAELEVYLHSFLTLAGQLPASCLSRFTPEQIVPSSHWIEGSVGPSMCLDFL